MPVLVYMDYHQHLALSQDPEHYWLELRMVS